MSEKVITPKKKSLIHRVRDASGEWRDERPTDGINQDVLEKLNKLKMQGPGYLQSLLKK